MRKKRHMSARSVITSGSMKEKGKRSYNDMKGHVLYDYNKKKNECLDLMAYGEVQSDGTRKFLGTNDIIKRLGIARSTFYHWKNDETFLERLKELSTNTLRETLPMVDRVIISKALKGDMGAIRMFYQRQGLLTDKAIIGVQSLPPLQVVIEEYKEESNVTDIEITNKDGDDEEDTVIK